VSIRIHRDLDHVCLSGVVLAIGNFDGIHRGHQAIMAAGRRLARVAGTDMVAMTFEPHPASILAPDPAPRILTPLDEKIRCLDAAGADAVVVVESRPEFFNCPAETFIDQIIVQCFHPIAMVEGASFRFGQHRHGDVKMLAEAGKSRGFDMQVVPPVRVGLGGHPDTVISSTLVRHLLNSGTVDRAVLCLGRPYALFGQVAHGAARGRTLGFATANLAVHPGQLIPAEGVYAGQASIGGHTHPVAISIGTTPTFGGHHTIVEAHVLDFVGDLYDQPLRLEFLDWLRPQQKFDSPAALQKQIQTDIDQTRQVCVKG
jgi:riboflavin kinase/FMN adenylyltransferase